MKVLYKPIGLIVGVLAGLVANKIFAQIWGAFDDEEPPDATDRDVKLGKLVAAAALQGTIMRLTRTMVDRAGAKGVAHLTGRWPGESAPDDA